MLDIASIISIVFAVIGIVILIKAINNAYMVKKAIDSIKNKRSLNFVRFNIALAMIFVLCYAAYIYFEFLSYDLWAELISALLLLLFSGFILVASIVTREMGRLLYKIDKIRKLDPLTKIFNRAEIEKHIAKEFSRCVRYKRHASLIIIDINNFKSVNDTYGHQAGDKVILDLIKTVQQQVRTEDIFGRYGGDEFIIIMPETKVEAAENFVNRLQKAINNQTVNYESYNIKYTVSIGISEVNFGQSSYENWLRVTDKDLYKAKANNAKSVLKHYEKN